MKIHKLLNKKVLEFLKDMPLRTKLMAVVMITTVIALLLSCLAFITYEFTSYKAEKAQEILTIAKIIASNSTAALEFEDPNSGTETLSALSEIRQVSSSVIYDKNGNVFATYFKSEKEQQHKIVPKAENPLHPSVIPPFDMTKKENVRIQGRELLVTLPILLHGERVGTILINADISELYSRLIQFAGILALVLIASSFVAFVLSANLQGIISKPILNLARIAEEISTKKDYSVREEKHSDDEIGFLIDKFNEMLSQIQERDQLLQKAYDDLDKRVHERTEELQNEVVERMRAESIIKTSLEEKSVLLKEIHHRVKNNLQIICSLLSLQSNYIKSTDNSDIFNESQNRIKSMALVHEFLFQSDNLASINFREYMNTLVDDLLSSYEADIYNISSVIKVEDITLDIDTAIPCGLIINELVSNSFKHAFPWAKENLGSDDRKNMISIELIRVDNGFYNLSISDNGKGFPPMLTLGIPTLSGLSWFVL